MSPLNKSEVTKDLKTTLKELGLSQNWAAKQLDITPTYFGRCLNGVCDPSLELAFKMHDLVLKLKASGLITAV